MGKNLGGDPCQDEGGVYNEGLDFDFPGSRENLNQRQTPQNPNPPRSTQPSVEQHPSSEGLEGFLDLDLDFISYKTPSTTRSARARGAHELFPIFWELAVKKVGKGRARDAFTMAGMLAPVADILKAWRTHNIRWSTWLPDRHKYIPHPATWLNGERWEDESLPEWGPHAMADMISSMSDEDAMHLLFGNQGYPPSGQSGLLESEGDLRGITWRGNEDR